MPSSKLLLTQPLKPLPISLVAFVLAIAFLGFVDATYLTVENYRGVIPPCTETSGCETVLTSSYSKVFGIPTSLFGTFYYLAILVGVFAYLEGKREKMLRAALLLTPIGFLVSLYLVYLQAFVIGSYCLYCLGSALTSTLLFGAAWYIFSRYRETHNTSSVSSIDQPPL